MIIKTINNINNYTKYDSHTLTIIDNTEETWQPNRTNEDKVKDTKNGKLAEDIIESYIKKNIKNIIYLSYDEFRSNNYKKHAPFDGILFNKDTEKEKVKKYIDIINLQITNNQYGKIEDSLKTSLSDDGIYIVEIKSTRVNEVRHYTNGSVDFQKLLKDDFLEYPKYLRVDDNGTINSLEDYILFCKKHRGFICKEEECIEKIIMEEYHNMRHIYIRVYIDEIQDIGYILGYINKRNFVQNMKLKKMSQKGKSEKALYLSCSLHNAKDIDNFNEINKK